MSETIEGAEIQKKKPSFERIRFDLRPAKSVQRKMMCEAFHRLSAFERVDRYRYVGMGSTYFSDFSLFHRSLGIIDMISIEREVQKKTRFRFNCPYKCVQVEFGESTSVLSNLTWETPTILWLDYDGKLTREILSDVKHACAKVRSGSVVTVTVNAQPAGGLKARLEQLRKRVGPDKIPIDVVSKTLKGWGLARVCRRILVNEIDETLKDRNIGEADADKMTFRQIFNFQYQGSARMLTVGGIVYAQSEAGRMKKCAFDQVPFIRDGAEPCRIEVPCLTYREIRLLDKLLPRDNPEGFRGPRWLPSVDVKRYARIYRYFPTFAETDL